jgi:hypothetical protein
MWAILSAIDFSNPTLLGLAALMTAVGGIASTIAAIRKARSEEEEKCLERLKEARAEAEAASAELHERKMRDAET